MSNYNSHNQKVAWKELCESFGVDITGKPLPLNYNSLPYVTKDNTVYGGGCAFEPAPKVRRSRPSMSREEYEAWEKEFEAREKAKFGKYNIHPYTITRYHTGSCSGSRKTYEELESEAERAIGNMTDRIWKQRKEREEEADRWSDEINAIARRRRMRVCGW